MLNSTSRHATLAVAVLVCSLPAWSQQTSVPVKKMMFRAIPSVNGKDLYKEYCVQCHGSEGRGDGPLASSLPVSPGDLTTIACRSEGHFNPSAVEDSITRWKEVPMTMKEAADRQNALAGKGTERAPAMPAFGPIFGKLYQDEVRDRRIRIINLVAYVKSMQVKGCPAEQPKPVGE